MTKTANSQKATAEKTFKDAQKTAQDTIEKTVKAAQKTAQDSVKAAQDNVQKAVKEAKGNLDNVVEFSKANYEALVESGNVAAKVAKTVNVDFMANAKKSAEKNASDVKALFAAKSPTEFFKLQTEMFKTRYEDFVAEATKVNEAVTATANEVVEPLKARYEEVATKYKLPLGN
ncbi:MAG: hypothetical protein COB54_08220 [Alphaproteobacteria bacterium]|nr:MAG: hypothetical protein COB54_08220 [Alphaproteobacteria bacterium]